MQAVTLGDGVKVYNLSSGKTLPSWLTEKRKRALNKDEAYRRRVELIQEFEFPVSSSCIRVTKDGQHIAATGTYPPSLKMFDVSQLSLKFERRLDSEATSLVLLGSDYGKVALLHGTERQVEFHAQFGAYFKTRVPRPARSMVYHARTCDLVVSGSSDEIWRLNLEQGRFLTSLRSAAGCTAYNVSDVNPVHGLLAFGSDTGVVECFDPRTRQSVAALPVAAHAGVHPRLADTTEITALQFAPDGLTMGVGTAGGACLLYDIRAPRPFVQTSHQNRSPVVSMRFHHGADGRDRVLSADSRVVKTWDKTTGSLLFALEVNAGKVADICTLDVDGSQSGLFFLAGEFPRMQVIYVPALGPAPRWCSFLDNLTEELEESAPNIYADFKFVTKQELAELGLDRLIGTNYLRAYMHGYFVDMRMYKKVKETLDPFAYDNYKKDLVKAKLDAKAKTRIFAKTKLPKVNAQLAQKLMEEQARADEKRKALESTSAASGSDGKKKVRVDSAVNMLKDPRFAALFQNEDFAIDADQARTLRGRTASRLLRESFAGAADDDDDEVLTEDEGDAGDAAAAAAAAHKPEDDDDDTAAGIAEHFTALQGGAGIDDSDDGGLDDDDELDDESAGGTVHKAFELRAGDTLGQALNHLLPTEQPGRRAAAGGDDEEDDEDEGDRRRGAKRGRRAAPEPPADLSKATLGARVEMEERRKEREDARKGPLILGSGRGFAMGEREMTFIPRKELRQQQRRLEERREAQRRSSGKRPTRR